MQFLHCLFHEALPEFDSALIFTGIWRHLVSTSFVFRCQDSFEQASEFLLQRHRVCALLACSKLGQEQEGFSSWLLLVNCQSGLLWATSSSLHHIQTEQVPRTPSLIVSRTSSITCEQACTIYIRLTPNTKPRPRWTFLMACAKRVYWFTRVTASEFHSSPFMCCLSSGRLSDF